MKINVNGETREVRSENLSDALTELDFGTGTVATAVNEAFVPASARADCNLTDGDRLEILAPMQGG